MLGFLGACLAEEGSDSADGGLVVVSMGSCDVSVHGRKVAELVPGHPQNRCIASLRVKD